MDIVAGLTAAGKALEIAKALRDLDRSLEGAEYRSRIADLIDQLTDTRIALSEARETIADKEAEIRRLTARNTGLIEVVGKDGFNFGIEGGKVRRLPFCPNCEQNGKQIQFSELGSGTYYCSVCNRVEHRLPSPPAAPG